MIRDIAISIGRAEDRGAEIWAGKGEIDVEGGLGAGGECCGDNCLEIRIVDLIGRVVAGCCTSCGEEAFVGLEIFYVEWIDGRSVWSMESM